MKHKLNLNRGELQMIPFFNLTKQYQSLKSQIDEAILSVCKSGIFCLGEKVILFEKELAKYIGINYAFGVNSGSASLILALEVLGIKEGDEVIVPANTYIATVFAVSHVNAVPVFIDHDDYYNINPDIIESKITEKTKVIIAVHLYGQPCQMDKILEISKKYNLLLIEDCAQALGAEYNNQKIGTFGDVACVSFYPGKNLGAYGDGGAILTNNDSLADKIKMLRNDGQKEKYNHEIIGYNERLDEIQAAILKVKLNYLDIWNNYRNNIAKLYFELIAEKGLDVIVPAIQENVKHVFHQFVIRVNNRDKVKKDLWEKYQIGTGIHYPVPVHKQKAYLEYNNISCPESENNAKYLLSLPMYPELTEEEVRYVIDSLQKVLKNE
jgi:dTDP-4-amino-4,6-dideoxygalactose transaminase